MLVLPAFIFMSMWAIAVPVAVLEGRGITASMSRSSYLTKGNRWRFLLIIVVFTTINIIVGLAINRVVGLLAGISIASPFAPLWVHASIGVGNFVAFSLIGPLGTIALSLAYYDERVRKEAFDLELMMAAIDAHQPSVAPAT